MSISRNLIDTKKYYFNDTSFSQLMQKRVNNILIICSKYDYFMLEEDGRIDEQIFNEYVSLSLRYPPVFIQADSYESAYVILSQKSINLIIIMSGTSENDVFQISRQIKKDFSDLPIVVLTHFSREISLKIEREDLSAIDYIFYWLGNTDLLIAIIKLIEDEKNAENDINEVGVQAILLVEDSIRFYSSYLPNIYKIVLTQSKDFMTEGANEHVRMFRMRGRPKILMASNFEDAISTYLKYQNNIIGVISDMSYKKGGITDDFAGEKLCEEIRKIDPLLSIILQSSDEKNEQIANRLKVGFLNKNSKTLSIELKNYIIDNFAFGDFIFRNPFTHEEIDRATDLQSLQQKILEVPDVTLDYHIKANHISKWLNARAFFSIAEILKPIRKDDFESIDEIRNYLYESISNFRRKTGRGIITSFDKDRFDQYTLFSRIGKGSIGGKARGLAFIDSFIKRNRIIDKYENVIVSIPRTVAISTDVFDEFMEQNDLYKFALSCKSNDKLVSKFVEASLPCHVIEDLRAYVSVIKDPIAIRSSSLLEDSHYQPFAGIYSTYMIPYIAGNIDLMVEKLTMAIKCVYASVFFQDSKVYMSNTSNLIDEEKMGIVLQEVSGKDYGNLFFPTISGVARSFNFYPIQLEKPQDGIANISFGLGKIIVEDGVSLRFSPKHPKKSLQLSSLDITLKDSQKYFYALDLNIDNFKPSVDDGINIKKIKIN